jgi:ferredoxin
LIEMEYTESGFLARGDLQRLIDVLAEAGHDVIGPTERQHAIVLDSIRHVDQLPWGRADVQQPASYRLRPGPANRAFGFTVGPGSWKRYLFPPQAAIAGARLDDEGWHFEPLDLDLPRYAFLGVRACDLAAIEIQDRVFLGGPYVDPIYQRLREQTFVVVVECATTAATCFCDAMGCGPRCGDGFDLALTELEEGYLLQSGSDAGAAVAEQLPLVAATAAQQRAAEEQMAATEASLDKSFDAEGVPELLMRNLDHPQWQRVAQRCLSCTNCTMVCPTCFCSTVEEVPGFPEPRIERVRRWDSCFNPEFSYTCGGTARPNIRSRYRQWLTHKLATWHEQFDTSGCVGCGRCITWCPVGIDLTEEVEQIRQSERT